MNENTNGLLQEYLPKGTELPAYAQADLDAVASKLNTRSRKTLDYRTPLIRSTPPLHRLVELSNGFLRKGRNKQWKT